MAQIVYPIQEFVGLNMCAIKIRFRSCGFTLVELMVTIAVAVLIMAVAAPNFLDLQRSSQLTSTTNTLTAALNSTRSEAMKFGTFSMLVPRDNTNWNSGWRVFVDKNLNQAFDAEIDELILEQPAPPDFLIIEGNGTAAETQPFVLYNGSGYSRTKAGGFGALTFTIRRNDVSAAQADSQTRRLIISRTGRVRSCRPASDATCTANTTN